IYKFGNYINKWNEFSSSLPTTTNEFEEENDDIKSQIRNVWRKISLKKLKKDNQFSVPSFITVFIQEMGKEKEEVNQKQTFGTTNLQK
ncbi:17693_t:CDS:2, partial [Gigaspora margarita]